MNREQPSNKTKIIASLLVIAAIAVIYFVNTALADKNTSARTNDIMAQPQSSTHMMADSSPHMAQTSYKDGSYSASGSYRTPQTTETIYVTVTVKNGDVIDSAIQQTPQESASAEYQAEFKNNYRPFVVGKKLSDIRLSHVSGSSLTSGGFNAALDEIKSQAAINS